jgi:hypothetical protein
MHPLILIFLVLGGVIVFPIIRYLMTDRHDSDLHAYLLSRGATDINVSYSYLLSEGNSQGYVVEYTNQQGKRCKTRCLIRDRNSFFNDGGIDWLEPPEV